MRKILFAVLVLAVGVYSCSQNDENENVSDELVEVKVGSESKKMIDPESKNTKSIIEPGGTTTWNIGDQVKIIDVDGVDRTFTHEGKNATQSAEFNGLLRAGQGKRIYKAFHAPTKSDCKLETGHILVVKREDLDITEDGVNYNSALFGSYCPMVAIPLNFDAEDPDDSKLFQFHHLTSMIEARVSLRDPEDNEFLDKTFNRVVFELKARGSKPFYTEIKFDFDLLNIGDQVQDFDECIVNKSDASVKTDFMSTTMNMEERTIRELMGEYASLKSFPIPIFALPTDDPFDYTATVYFYLGNKIQLKMEGNKDGATGLNPVGLNVLVFDYKKIVQGIY